MTKSHRTYGLQDIHWEGHRLRLSTGRLLATVEPDRHWAGMYRVRFRDGLLTDMVNLTRAKDAAIALALTNLNNKPGGMNEEANLGGVKLVQTVMRQSNKLFSLCTATKE